ncbi:MAG: hypothetical protein P1U87_01505 [Verrucomicrobiales bacterium]|nr:hypothetical protein [Verrucomicrobiales bacterium]
MKKSALLLSVRGLLSFTSLSAMESPSCLFLSAPSIKENYHRPKFDELIRFYAAFVKKQAPGDKVIVVADAETIAAIGNRIPRGEPAAGGKVPGADWPSLQIATVKSRDAWGKRIFV